MTGFFNIQTTSPTQKAQRGTTGCDSCGLYRQVLNPKIPLTGEGKKNVFIIGEAPGETEDRLNIQFVGQAGDMLKKHLRIAGFDLNKDFYKTNALLCRPTNEKGSNRTPTKKEIKCCEPLWRNQLASIEPPPSFIFLLGQKAVETFFMNRTHPVTTNLSIARWRKLCIPDSITKAWILPFYHPSFAVRNPDAEGIFKLDLQWALSQLNRTPPEFSDYKEKIIQLTNFDDLINILKWVIENKPTIGFDYETSGLKPYFPGHSIWSTSMAIYSEDKAYAWPHSYPDHWTSEQLEKLIKYWSQILTNPEIYKIAQNIQMEHPWSKQIIGIEVQGWIWDTMVRSHVEDERYEYTSLDFQTFINWGYEYGSNITKYKKEVPGTKFNRMHKVPLNELLEYNGLDSYFLMKLAERQWENSQRNDKEIKGTNKGYELFHEGILCFNDMEEAGIGVNTQYYQKVKIEQEKRESFLLKRISQYPEIKLFRTKSGRNIDLGSAADINTLLYSYLQLAPTKYTEKGNVSADAEVLENLDLPFAKDIVKVRQIEKNKVTYIEGILNEEVDGRIHPNFNLHLVTSYRSSGSNPNVQNLPRKDKASMELIRGGIIPTKGWQIGEADYGAVEVRIIACYSKDPILLKNLKDGIDIHQEWANFLGCSRFDAKNTFVFPLFYGSYYKSIYYDLVSRGYNISIGKVQQAEMEFWKKYKVAKRFFEELYKFHRVYGYIEMFTGFRRRGWLSRNQISNIPIQGTAFHCLLWAAIQVNKIRKEENWKTKLIAQIHDSLILDIYPSELAHVITTVRRVMTVDILKVFPWIIVPLLAEIEVAEIDMPWHTKEEYDE